MFEHFRGVNRKKAPGEGSSIPIEEVVAAGLGDQEGEEETEATSDATTEEETATEEETVPEYEPVVESSETTVKYVPFTVNSGESSDTVAANLYKAGLVDSASEFNDYMNTLGVDNRIQSGTFYVKADSTYDDIIVLLVNKDHRTTTPPAE